MAAPFINPGYSTAVVIVPSATVNFDGSTDAVNPLTRIAPADAVYVGGAGIVQLVLENHSVVAFTCVAGQVLAVRAIRVNATSTATLMVALYQN